MQHPLYSEKQMYIWRTNVNTSICMINIHKNLYFFKLLLFLDDFYQELILDVYKLYAYNVRLEIHAKFDQINQDLFP